MNDYKLEQLDKKLDKFFSPKVQGALRHFLTSAGGVLVAKGYVDAGIVEAGVGVIMTGLGFYWSWASPEKKL